MGEPNTFVGLDVHRKDIAVAMLTPGRGAPLEWRVPNEPTAVRSLARKLQREGGGAVHCVYEAGPCGYTLQRQLCAMEIECDVVAPSMIPVRPGERIKTDRRDARKLAELARAGILTVVHPPSEDEEAVRDLCRVAPQSSCDTKLYGGYSAVRWATNPNSAVR